ncbi:hypothetical protein ACTRXD_03650 [Nitrospira sp. T9]|uniref:hypothetical protein n=1 Tax=unclassified Nitrospira TaxID=2652172 RepID=UPI003F9B7E6A
MITKEAAFLCIGRHPAGQVAAVQVSKMGLRVGHLEAPGSGRFVYRFGSGFQQNIPRGGLGFEATQSLKRMIGELHWISPPVMGQSLDKVSSLISFPDCRKPIVTEYRHPIAGATHALT